ncbi:hypothetical protein GCM10012279_33190 [Micromonospora yangpuensis]|nr:hypothetical protein GCM10012279_33190 [Micromonospora yangpuensis]
MVRSAQNAAQVTEAGGSALTTALEQIEQRLGRFTTEFEAARQTLPPAGTDRRLDSALRQAEEGRRNATEELAKARAGANDPTKFEVTLAGVGQVAVDLDGAAQALTGAGEHLAAQARRETGPTVVAAPPTVTEAALLGSPHRPDASSQAGRDGGYASRPAGHAPAPPGRTRGKT